MISEYANWMELEAAEAKLYLDEGTHAYTSVMPREGDHGVLDGMWQEAAMQVENDGEERDANEQREEIARRVAAAQAILVFGPEFLSGKAF